MSQHSHASAEQAFRDIGTDPRFTQVQLGDRLTREPLRVRLEARRADLERTCAKLREADERARAEIAEVDEAIEALNANADLEKLLDAVARAL